MRNMTRKWAYIIPAAIVGALLFIAVGGFIVLELWNWLLPAIFGWHAITFWQAVGLLALCRILFGGWGRHVGHRSNFRRRMDRRWEQMTPEERERFRQGLRGRCGFTPPAAEGEAP